MNEINISSLEPFDVHPLLVAEQLYADTPRWRWLKRRRLAAEARRITSSMNMVELQTLINQRRAKFIEAKELLR